MSNRDLAKKLAEIVSQEPRDRRVTTMFTETEYAAMEALAARAGVTVSDVIRGALRLQGAFDGT